MMKRFFCAMLLTLVMSMVADAAVIYSEDFTSDPGFTTSAEFGIDGQADSATWNSSEGWYQVHLKEYGGGAYNGATKFAVTPTFSKIENQSFTLSFDMYYDHGSFGMGVEIWALDGPVRSKEEFQGIVRENVALMYYFNGDDHHGRNMYLWGSSTNTQTPLSNEVSRGMWYSHFLSYNSETEMIDYIMTEKSNGNVFYSASQILPISAFDRLAFGHATMFYDGTSSELWVDNINVSIVPEPTTLLLLGLGGLFLRKRKA